MSADFRARLATVLRAALLAGLTFPGAPSSAPAQQEAVVEQVAPILAAEDSRNFLPALFRSALVAPDSVVRRLAATAAGRIGDLQATPLLLPLLSDADSTVRVAAAFALGLLRDTAAAQPLMDRITGLPALDGPSSEEALVALAKIGGPGVGRFFGGILGGSVVPSREDRRPLLSQIVLESWRLGPDAPTQALLPFLEDTAATFRWRAAYSLGRLRAPAAAAGLTVALRDPDVTVRAMAARGLTRSYVDSAGLAPKTVTALLLRAVTDPEVPVRVNALRSLADFRDSSLASKVVPLLGDPVPSVQVQAAMTAGALGGAEAARGLARIASGKGPVGVRREALVALARVDSAAFTSAVPRWQTRSDWRERAAAAEGAAIAGSGPRPWFLSDRDARVVAAGLQAWAGEVEGPDPALIASARPLVQHADAAVRSVAADALARTAKPDDLAMLAAAYRRSRPDSFPDAALAALGGILAIRKASRETQVRVDQEFAASAPRPDDYVIRRWAEENWPELADRWGGSAPITTGRSPQDYRDLTRRYVLAPDSLARPKVTIDTDQRGPIEIELLGPEAPLTVANFVRLIERRFFDGNRWHRVVPNFVVQDGDPRGDGFGSPGGAIRDEINRHRYGGSMLGMALSGPDTGSSQWFINLSPQPHLDGTYTIFGRVTAGQTYLARITQGELIRTIRVK
ncbi:MAG: peptidylprolyl isomerase [Gemmatimonadales bacterium]|nr:peptidylprolyl isomerase [Gemmatimonadales bacterium]